MNGTRLMTPGPTQLPAAVLSALGEPVLHHRTPQYAEMFRRVRERLGEVFRSDGEIVVMSGTGTLGMEAAVVNLHSPGDTVIAVAGGKFGDRWVQMARAHGLEVVVIEVTLGEAVEPGAVAEALQRHPAARSVLCTLVETSTATVHDIGAIGKIVAPTGALLVVDGISAIGAQECQTTDWSIDVLIVGSQKGLLLPPGLAILALSEAAQARIQTGGLPRFYLDLRRFLASHQKNQDPWTGSVSLIRAADVSLELLLEEGMESVWARHRRMARACRASLQLMNLPVFSSRPSDNVTAAVFPEGIDGTKVIAALRDEMGIAIAGGQNQLKGRLLRIGHMGDLREADLFAVLSSLERVLVGEGVPSSEGAGLRAAHEVFSEPRAL